MAELKNDQYAKIPIGIAQRFAHTFPFDLFLKLSDSKFIKLSNKNDDVTVEVEKYAAKGVTEIFVIKSQYMEFLNQAQKNLQSKFEKEDIVHPTADNVMLLNDYHKILKDNFKSINISEKSIELTKSLAQASLKLVFSTPSIATLIAEFKDKCSEEFLKAITVGYMTSCMIDTFSWHSNQIKQKLVVTSILCDINLSSKELLELKKNRFTPELLSEKILNHPQSIKKLIDVHKNKISQEVITIIEQHHEMPQGTGFPHKKNHQSITQLTAIYQVAHDFIEYMIDNNFADGSMIEISGILHERYNLTVYKKAVRSLEQVLKL